MTLATLVESIIWLQGPAGPQSAREVIGSEVELRAHLRFQRCDEWCRILVHFLYICNVGEAGQDDAAVSFNGFDRRSYIMQRHAASHYGNNFLVFPGAISRSFGEGMRFTQ